MSSSAGTAHNLAAIKYFSFYHQSCDTVTIRIKLFHFKVKTIGKSVYCKRAKQIANELKTPIIYSNVNHALYSQSSHHHQFSCWSDSWWKMVGVIYDGGQTCCRNRKPEKNFRCNIEDKVKERRTIWRKNHTGMCGRVWFEQRRSID